MIKSVKYLFALACFCMISFYSIGQPVTNYYCVPCNSLCDEETFSEAGECDHCGMELIQMTPEERTKQMKDIRVTIAFYLQDGVEVLDFAGPMEVFAYAGFKVFTVSKTKDPITSQGILTVVPDYSIDDAPEADILAFFGGNSSVASSDPEVIKWVKNQSNVDYHFSVCTGAFILAESEILDGKTVTTFHNSIDNLKNNYPKAKVLDNVRFVDNGKVITTAGISAGIDGALHLVAKLKGLQTARLAAYYMEYDKWQPGEGLILSEDNPYSFEQLTFKELKVYEGVYAYENDMTVSIVAGKEGNTLYAVIGEKVFPVFYVSKDQYVNTGGDLVSFLREGDKITGFTSQGKGPFKKLKDNVDEARGLVAKKH